MSTLREMFGVDENITTFHSKCLVVIFRILLEKGIVKESELDELMKELKL